MGVSLGLRRVGAMRYVTALREGGSLPGLVEADDDGLYVTKFRGAGQGPLALVAEVIVGELARGLGLAVPELVLIDLAAELAAAEPDPEIKELVERSSGTNLGLDFLPGALGYAGGAAWQPDDALAADVVWLDALTLNVDRTARNPNLLLWHGRLWLIDHGAALYPHHAGPLSAADAARPFPGIAEHVLLPRAASILEAHERLAPRVTSALLEELVALVPDAWLPEGGAGYAAFLEARVAGASFATEAERARARA